MTEKYHEKKLNEERLEKIERLEAENESLKAQLAEQSDALIELAEMIVEG